MFTDTHCHAADINLRFRLPEILSQATQLGVSQLLAPAATPDDWQPLLALAQQPEIRAVALGVHPYFCERYTEKQHADLAEILQQNPHVLLGEIGLDFHDKTRSSLQFERQQQIFRLQLDLARQFCRPIVAHNVKSYEKFIQIIQQDKFTHGGIAHAFSGSLEQANLLIKNGFKIGIGTLLLNPNAKKTRAAAQNLPLTALLIETDSPFWRGGTDSTPMLLAKIAAELARLRGMDLADLAAQLEINLREILAFQAA